MRYRGSRQSLLAVLVALLALLFLLPAPAAAPAATGEDTLSAVGGRVMCQCGCGLVLANCPHRNCGWGVPAKEFIDGQLASGRSGDEIVEYYVSQYGEQILASPPKSGFNLTAWITPFVALAGGVVGLYYLVTSWARRRDRDEVGEVVASRVEASEDLVAKLDEELEEFD